MNELEEKLLEEVNPLIEEWLLREESKTEELNAWVDQRTPYVAEETKYHDEEEDELLQKLEEEKGYQDRKKIIAEILALRKIKKQIIKGLLSVKFETFVKEQKEQTSQALEEKDKQLLELEEKGKQLLTKRKNVLKIKNTINANENTKIYKATKEEENDIMAEMRKLSKQYHAIEKEKRNMEAQAKQLEEKYSQIDWSNIESLREKVKQETEKEKTIEETKQQEQQTVGAHQKEEPLVATKQPEKELQIIDVRRTPKREDNSAKVKSKQKQPTNTQEIQRKQPVKTQQPKEDKQLKDTQVTKTNLKEKELDNEAVRILYSARTDKYLVINQNKQTEEIVGRKELRHISKKHLAEKNGRTVEDLKNIDMNILQLLIAYDKQNQTSKAKEYYTMMTQIGKSKKDRQQEMKEHQIDIEYNLNGLYDKNNKINNKEKRKLLHIANNAKQKGIATMKKGMKVKTMEFIDKIFEKFKLADSLPKGEKIFALPESKKAKQKRQQKEKEYAELVNGEYMKTLDSDYEKAVKETRKKQFKANLKAKVLPNQMQKQNTNETFQRMDSAAKKLIEEQEREEK